MQLSSDGRAVELRRPISNGSCIRLSLSFGLGRELELQVDEAEAGDEAKAGDSERSQPCPDRDTSYEEDQRGQSCLALRRT